MKNAGMAGTIGMGSRSIAIDNTGKIHMVVINGDGNLPAEFTGAWYVTNK
jgi:hypothetical protein